MTDGLDNKSWGLLAMSLAAAVSLIQVYTLVRQSEYGKQRELLAEL